MANYVDTLSSEQKKRAALIVAELKAKGITNKYVVAGILSVVSKESNFLRLKEAGYQNTSNSRIRSIFGSRVAGYSEAALTSLKQDYNKFFEAVYGGAWGAKSLGNTQPGDGYRYVGRGYNQITGRGNYAVITKDTGVDVLSNPSLLETPEVAAKAIAAYFAKNIAILVNNGKFAQRYGVPNSNGVNKAETGLHVAYDINAGSTSQKYSDTTGGYKTSSSRIDSFVNSLADLGGAILKNKFPIGLALLAGGAYYLYSKGIFAKILG